ncbi:uncharacterized protein [Drosophila kikkawai]|uniref:MD-2-related lipid-recognition protein-like n=1 Tax=Drosophila kikkawai TaxID=30033 RepID=A0ABM4GAA3_DROKI
MTTSQVIYFWLFWLTYLGYNHVKASYKFNSLDCEFLAPEFGRVNVCEIKAIDRKRNMLNIETILAKTIDQFEIKFKVFTKYNGLWQPFLYDMTVDVCQYFKNPKKFFIASYMYSFLQPYTNINHTCPYMAGTSILLWNFTPDEGGVLAKFPAEQGQYGLNATYYVNKVAAVQLNGTLLFFK